MNKKCPAGWIGLGSEKQIWPPCSPDLAPCDYGLWPYVLEKVKRRGATSRDELRTFIEEEFDSIPQDVLINIYNSMQRRCEILLHTKGENVDFVMVEE